MKLREKVAVITGGGKGIGKAVALLFAKEGAQVVVADLDFGLAQQTVAEIARDGGNHLAVKVDVASSLEVAEMAARVKEAYGRIDILVNCAGICEIVPFIELSEAAWDRMMDINLKGTFLCSQAAMKMMMEAKSGCIVSIASLAGKVGGIAAGAHYAASKAGVICLTMSMARLGAPYGIRVNAVAPGPIATDMTAVWPEATQAAMTKSIPLGRMGEAEEVAEAILFLCSPAAAFITGETMNINGGILMD
ncbi:MAG: 3-oxoacyl-ACP reductase FabG [Syntrophomonadaceae bacterium]|nr:3-oxoacyl-ACP reductase FabG [Syntrophomonadaceae bacterium]